ncbi:MAG TPA: GNAT family N-acetyltransferase [Rariglobus sp.]|jgi:hypothetical protein
MQATPPPVRHDIAGRRFTLSIDGQTALADYLLEDGRMVCTHTYVPPALRGRGLAGLLVHAVLDHARSHHLRVVPACSYVAAFIEQHPEFGDLLA